jgi:hypothetical protein
VTRPLLALLLAAACAHPALPPPPVAAGPAPAWSYPALRWRGMALGLWDHAAPEPAYAARLDEIAALGADAVLLPVSWRQTDVRSVELAPDPATTIPDETLREVIRAAHARRLAVLLFPIVHLDVIEAGAWRGTLAPRDVDAWWRAYRGFVTHYATLAAEEGVEVFSIGSELGATEAWRDRWYALASEVERGYPGTLLYSANWDHYQHVSFWERVDAVGISAYAPLAARDGAADAELERAWRRTRAELTAFAAARGKPLVITELGYPSRAGAATAPWDYTRGGDVDLDEQRRCFAAFAAAWDGEAALAGVFVWIWWGAGGERDGGYTPRGKPAAEVIRRMFVRPGT